jgi:hypothetical protein
MVVTLESSLGWAHLLFREDKSMSEPKTKKLYGGAALLHTHKQHRLAASVDGSAVANGLGSGSLTRHGSPTTANDFGTAARVNRDVMRHGCDIQAEKEIRQIAAISLIRQHFAEMGRRLFLGELDGVEHEDVAAH